MEKLKTALKTLRKRTQKPRARVTSFLQRYPLIYKLLIALPVLLFALPILLSGENITPGDADYQFQLYEAFRRSVLEFGQFPFWNPWVSGGIPLFSNIQFGLISVQTPFILIFGAVMGFKLSYLAFLLIGFFGFRALFTQIFKTPELNAVLLALIWSFGTFTTYRVSGHFTFLLFHFVPWALLFYFRRHEKWGWLKLALILSLMVWSSPHYATIMTFAVLGFVFLFESIKFEVKDKWFKFNFSLRLPEIKLWAKIFGVILALCFYRLYFVYEFIKDFPRPGTGWPEPFFGIGEGLYTMFGPIQFGPNIPQPPVWSWLEASAYIGVLTGVALVLVIIGAAREKKGWQKVFTYSPIILSALFIFFFVLAQGRFFRWAPFAVLQEFPIFESMRVAMRWFIWCSIITLCIIAAYKGKFFKHTITVLLAITVVELFVISQPQLQNTFTLQPQQYRSATAPFEQQVHFDTPRAGVPYDENLYATTRSNYGQVIAGDALVDTRQPNSTIRCGASQGCAFVMSKNAEVTRWTPNAITLKRTTPGDIELNMNPGSGWRINDAYPFAGFKEAEPLKRFIIGDKGEQEYKLEYAPKLSPDWLLWRARQLVQ